MNQTRAGCRSIYAIEERDLNNVGGFAVCGLRGGSNFIETQRPIDLQGNCPTGYQACNPKADADKKVCVDSAD